MEYRIGNKVYTELFTEQTIGEFYADLVEKQPDHPFIMYPDRNLVWSYKDFDKRTDDMARVSWRSASVAATMWAYGETYLNG